MKILSRAVCFNLFFCLFSLLAQSANCQPVVINEIAWMGTQNSPNDEWIEIYNNTGSQKNLSGWKLVAEDGAPEINLTGNISANGFYLLERTNDDTVPTVAADQIYTGPLENAGETLILYDDAGNIADKTACSSGWYAGDNQTHQTMERVNSEQVGIDPANWQTSRNSGGTPKAKNSLAAETPSPPAETPPPPAESSEPESEVELPSQESQAAVETQEPEPKEEPSPKPTEETSAQPNPIIYPSGIIINEILPSPEGSDETDEWIEIKNQNQFEVNLSGWQIKDSNGAITTFKLPAGTKIPASSFLVLSRPLTKIILNNDADGVSLLRPDNKIVETINYSKAPTGQSYSRLDSAWFWTNQLTPGTKNIISEEVSQTGQNELSENTVKDKDLQDKKGLSAIGAQATKNSFFVILIALSLAVISAIIILMLKIKVKKN